MTTATTSSSNLSDTYLLGLGETTEDSTAEAAATLVASPTTTSPDLLLTSLVMGSGMEAEDVDVDPTTTAVPTTSAPTTTTNHHHHSHDVYDDEEPLLYSMPISKEAETAVIDAVIQQQEAQQRRIAEELAAAAAAVVEHTEEMDALLLPTTSVTTLEPTTTTATTTAVTTEIMGESSATTTVSQTETVAYAATTDPSSTIAAVPSPLITENFHDPSSNLALDVPNPTASSETNTIVAEGVLDIALPLSTNNANKNSDNSNDSNNNKRKQQQPQPTTMQAIKWQASSNPNRVGRWTLDEKLLFLYGLQKFGKGRWKKISLYVPDRSLVQIKSHAQKVLKRFDAGENVFRRMEENCSRLHFLVSQIHEAHGLEPPPVPTLLFQANSNLVAPTAAAANVNGSAAIAKMLADSCKTNHTHKKQRCEDGNVSASVTATDNNETQGNNISKKNADGTEHILAASALCQLAGPEDGSGGGGSSLPSANNSVVELLMQDPVSMANALASHVSAMVDDNENSTAV